MLTESRLYSFLHHQSGHALHFLEGQRLISDLSLITELKGESFYYLRDAVLSLQPLIAMLKPGEGLGLYIDLEEPYLRFKLETNHDGLMRTLILPAELESFPETLNGIARISKLMPGQTQPYNSAIELINTLGREITNLLLAESYQTPGVLHVSEESDQSVLYIQLPRPNVNKEEAVERASVRELFEDIKPHIDKLFAKHSTDQATIQGLLEGLGFHFLSSRQVKFKCSCTFERMLMGIQALVRGQGIDEVFEGGKDTLEAKCDYCQSYYLISRSDCLSSPKLS